MNSEDKYTYKYKLIDDDIDGEYREKEVTGFFSDELKSEIVYSMFEQKVELLAECIIPEGVTAIEAKAFAGCRNLEKVEFPKSLRSIGEYAFYYCVSLSDVNIPEDVVRIKKGAFAYCKSLFDIKLPNSLKYIDSETFYGCEYLEMISIPKDIIDIGHLAFAECTSLRSVNLPKSIRFIGKGAFVDCRNLTIYVESEEMKKEVRIKLEDTTFNIYNIKVKEKANDVQKDTLEESGPTLVRKIGQKR